MEGGCSAGWLVIGRSLVQIPASGWAELSLSKILNLLMCSCMAASAVSEGPAMSYLSLPRDIQTMVSWPGERSCSVVWRQVFLYLLSDGSRVNRLWLGGCCLLVSFRLCTDMYSHSCHWCSVDVTSDVLVVLITHHRAFLSWAEPRGCIHFSINICTLLLLCCVTCVSVDCRGSWLAPEFPQNPGHNRCCGWF